MGTFMRLAKTGGAGTIALLLLSSCSWVGQNGDRLPLPPVATGRATRHAVESAQLRDVMSELRSLSLDRLPQELENPSSQQSRLREVVSIAAELSKASTRISGVVDEVGLTSEQQETFLALASRLGEEAQTLSDEAGRGESSLVDRTMDEVNATCVACHDLFRNPPNSSDGQAF